MKQTILSKSDSPLLENAITKLTPGVFSHPAWVRFGNKEKHVSSETIKELFTEAENLRKHNPIDACQVLLVCAAFQHYAGHTSLALTTIQMTQDLAEQAGHDQVILWTLWGACAICVQQKRFQEAATYLSTVQALLSDQDDWILSNFVDIVRQTLLQQGTNKTINPKGTSEKKSLGKVLSVTLQRLNTWGSPARVIDQEKAGSPDSKRATEKNTPFFSFQRWQGRWHSLRLMFKGELKVHWLDSDSGPRERRSSLWAMILSMFHIEVVADDNEVEVIEIQSPPPERVTKSPMTDPIPVISPNVKREVKPAKNIVDQPDRSQEAVATVYLTVHMLGSFSIAIQEKNLKLPSSRSLSLFEYLLMHHTQNTPREVLMAMFWPDAPPDTARNNLNVAIHSIRRALRSVIFMPMIVFDNGGYGLETTLQVWIDVEEFERCVKAGKRFETRNQLASAVAKYEAAISLYQGDFLEENPYDEWTVYDRERLRIAYLETLDQLSQIYFRQERYAMCITVSKLTLTHDRCREDAHCMLMRCYSRQGQDHLALRQYQACVEALRLELNVTPAPETTKLYELIRQHRYV